MQCHNVTRSPTLHSPPRNYHRTVTVQVTTQQSSRLVRLAHPHKPLINWCEKWFHILMAFLILEEKLRKGGKKSKIRVNFMSKIFVGLKIRVNLMTVNFMSCYIHIVLFSCIKVRTIFQGEIHLEAILRGGGGGGGGRFSGGNSPGTINYITIPIKNMCPKLHRLKVNH